MKKIIFELSKEQILNNANGFKYHKRIFYPKNEKDLLCKLCKKNLRFYKKNNEYFVKSCRCSNKSNKWSMFSIFNKEDAENFYKQDHFNRTKRTFKQRIYEENDKKIADKLYQEYKEKISQSKNSFIKRYGKIEGLKKYEIFVNKSKQTKENFIKRLGNNDGQIEWEKFIVKKRNSSKRSLNYWLEKFEGNYNVAQEYLSNYQKRNLEFFVKKYGIDIGLKKFDKRRIKQSESLKNYLADEEKRKLCGNTLENFVRKYGEDKGFIKYKEKNSKCSHTLENMIRRYGEEDGLTRYIIHKKNLYFLNKKIGSSKIAENLFDIIYKKLINYKENIFYIKENREYFLNDKENKKFYLYDFTFIKDNIKFIIEFNGDFWHANPDIYNENFFHTVKRMSAKEMWQDDKKKIDFAKKKDFNVLIIWEKDYRNNKEKTIEIVDNFIKEQFNGSC